MLLERGPVDGDDKEHAYEEPEGGVGWRVKCLGEAVPELIVRLRIPPATPHHRPNHFKIQVAKAAIKETASLNFIHRAYKIFAN